MKNLKVILALIFALIMFSGSWYGPGNDDHRRDQRVKDSQEILELLYKDAPETKELIKSAYGYATFKNGGVTMIFFSAEAGVGIAHENTTSKVTYMNVVSGGMGMGLGITDFRIIFIFETKKAFKNFVSNGWEAHAQADAALKLDEDGEAVNEAITVKDGVKICKLTQNGLSMSMTIQGSKFFKAKDLN